MYWQTGHMTSGTSGVAQQCDEPFEQIGCELAWRRPQISRNALRQAEWVLTLEEARARKLGYGVLLIN